MDVWLFLLKYSQTLTEEDTLKLGQKLPDLKNAFGILELYATDPKKTDVSKIETSFVVCGSMILPMN